MFQSADLDKVDRRILSLLHGDARITNNALAETVGIAPSTCHGRVRRLVDLGVIRGFYTDIDPVAVGLPLQAMISVNLQSNDLRSFVVDNLNADTDVAGTQTSLIFEHLRGAAPI